LENTSSIFSDITIFRPHTSVTSKPAVVLLSGWLGRSNSYTYLAEKLCGNGYYVIQPDLGAVWATWGKDWSSSDFDLVNDLVHLLPKISEHSCYIGQWDGYALVGHSRGGKIAALLHGCSRAGLAETTRLRVGQQMERLSNGIIEKIQKLDIKASFLIDPLNNGWGSRPFHDTKIGGPIRGAHIPYFSRGNLDAIGLLKELQDQMQGQPGQPYLGILGAGTVLKVTISGIDFEIYRPRDHTYEGFCGADKDNIWRVYAPAAAHLDFCSSPGNNLFTGFFVKFGKVIEFLVGHRPEGNQMAALRESTSACVCSFLNSAWTATAGNNPQPQNALQTARDSFLHAHQDINLWTKERGQPGKRHTELKELRELDTLLTTRTPQG
jgi:hypothetical protein